MILVDTSVWVRHLRVGDRRLADLLQEGEVFCHPIIIGELACGRHRRRAEILPLVGALPSAPVVDNDEVLLLLERERLHGLGLGWADVHLLGSALIADCGFWTRDRLLKSAAQRFKIAYSPPDR